MDASLLLYVFLVGGAVLTGLSFFIAGGGYIFGFLISLGATIYFEVKKLEKERDQSLKSLLEYWQAMQDSIKISLLMGFGGAALSSGLMFLVYALVK